METGVKEPLELTTKEPITPPILTSLTNKVKSNSTDAIQNKKANEVSTMSDDIDNINIEDGVLKADSVNATDVADRMAKSKGDVTTESTISTDVKSDGVKAIMIHTRSPIKEEPGSILETKSPGVRDVDGVVTTATTQPETPSPVTTIQALEPTIKLIRPSMNSTNVEQLTVQPLNREHSKTEPKTIVPSTTEKLTTESTIEQTTPTVEPTTVSTAIEKTTASSTIELTTAPATIEQTTPTTIEPSTKPSTIEPTSEPSTIEPTTKPSTIDPTTKPSTIEPTTKTSIVVPTTKPSTIEPTTTVISTESKVTPTVIKLTTTSEATKPVTSKATPKPIKPSTTEKLIPEKSTTSYIETTHLTTVEPPFNLGKAIGDGFQKKDPLVIGITAGAGVLVLVILILVIVCICRCRRRRRGQPKLRQTNRHDIARGSIDDIFRDKGYTRLAHKENNANGNQSNTIEMSPLLRNRSVMNRSVMNRDALKATGQTFLGNDSTSPDLHNHSGDDPTSPLTTPNDIESPSDLSTKPDILDPNIYEVDLSTEDLNLESANHVPTRNGDIENSPFIVVNENNPFNANNNKPRSYIRDSNPVGEDEDSNPFDNAPRPNPFRTSRTVSDYQYE
ncbi:unnamed protein product [Owenia fusiformis]|uniref:Uncharacterized protein n=1 Tax=Owenia fusiformis TaxID=6347 RepID=A0A8J1TVA8_OWEFU|nr:unnamed protein product [Owenia fusiformis]